MTAESDENATMPRETLASIAQRHGTDKVRYCNTYERYLGPLRDQPVRLFEIGVGGYSDPAAGGASVRTWKEYFPQGVVYALDYYDKSAHEEERIRIFRGSQTDPDVLHRIRAEMERMDIVLDDGSHRSPDVIASFEILFPLLAPGGLYIVEDLGTSYWTSYGGSEDLLEPSTSVSYFKRLVDGLQSASFRHSYVPSYADLNAAFVHFYPNLVIIRKK
jgi:hypothetical protein